MADKKISALTALAQGDVVVSTDVLPIVDTSATETKKIAVNALVGAAAAAGLTNVDINSGTIDGTTIATSDITVGSGKTLNVSAGTLTLADNQISGDKVEGGTINAITINTLTSTAVNATTVDATNVEVTNIKAKDGTAAATIADSTGIVSLSANPILSGGTANGVLYLNGSKVATSGSALNYASGTGVGNLLEVTGGTNNVNGQLNIQGTDGTDTSFVSLLSGLEPTNLPSLFFSNGLRFATATNKAASGYSEKMRLDSSGNLGIGTSSPGAKLDVRSGATADAVEIGSTATTAYNSATNSSVVNCRLQLFGGNATNSYTAIRFSHSGSFENFFGAVQNSGGTGEFVWGGYTGSSYGEWLRLDSSGNLGIGTSSPGSKLVTAINSANTNTLTYASFRNLASGYGSWAWQKQQSNDLVLTYGTDSDTPSTTAVYFAYGGNLGLGVTPSAWNSSYKVMDVSAWGSIAGEFGTQGTISLVSNCFANSTGYNNWTYKNTAPATRYKQYNGEHQFFTAPSGTAGDPITFTQAMTLDASGRLLVGNTSANTVLTRTIELTGASTDSLAQPAYICAANVGTSANFTGYFQFYRSRGTTAGSKTVVASGDRLGMVRFAGADGSNYIPSAEIYGEVDGTPGTDDMPGRIVFATTADGASSTTERARITSGGSFGLGTTSPSIGAGFGIHVAKTDGAGVKVDALSTNAVVELQAGTSTAAVWGSTNHPLIFGTNATERARITSGGEFLVGRTTSVAGERLSVSGSNADWMTVIANTNASPRGIFVNHSTDSNGTANWFLYCEAGGSTQRMSVRSNGGIANYQSNNVDLSDARTKKDITPAASMWDKIGALEIVTYKYNDQTHDDVNVGVIAQQVESVEPVWVDADGWGSETPEDGVPLKTVYTKDITFAAIKALQEAMARIEKLEAEMAALKGA